MSNRDRLRVLLVAADCDGEDVSEAYNAYKWVTELSKRCDVTLLTEFNGGRRPPSEQVRNARVIEWQRPSWLGRAERFTATAKPGYVRFFWKARRQIEQLLASGQPFDLLHQLTPNALRYPTVCCGFGIPYIIGPKAGGLPTPPGFAAETGSAPWYTHLRGLDRVRFRCDPLLRKTYTEAAVVLGTAPYVRQLLSRIDMRRFEVEFDAGIDDLQPERTWRPRAGIRLLHVGRAVRTKGLRDVVRAMARIGEDLNVTLTVAGDGEELDICRQEAVSLGVAKRIKFLGRLPRHEVEHLYSEADMLVHPSFREPGGGVVLEAMRRGLPIITTDVGGPGYLVTDTSGVRLPAHNPDQLAGDLAAAITRLATNPSLLSSLGAGARERVAEIGLWENKIDRTMKLYRSVLSPVPLPARAAVCAAAEG